VAAEAEAVAELGLADLYGRSVYAHWRTPPRQAYMSCAFDATCLGLYVDGTKYILQLSTGVVERYRPDPDELEEHDTASTLPTATRNRVSGLMRAWQHAVQELHPRVSSATSCPYEAPFAIRKWSPVRTHCCSAPEVRIPEGMYQAWMIGRCPRGYELLECPAPPCTDHKDAKKVKARVDAEYQARVLRQQLAKKRAEAEASG